MRFTEKVQRRLRNVFITLTIICLTPLFEQGRFLSDAHNVNTCAGKEFICAIDLGNDMYNSYGLETGLNYRLLNEFASANHCYIKIVSARDEENYQDSLLHGKIDILITRDTLTQGLIKLIDFNDHSSWAVHDSDKRTAQQMNLWIAQMKTSGYHNQLCDLYSTSYNPHKRAERGVTTNIVSPYDDIIKKHAKELGWDWRMVAAVVYQESKFSISSRSPRGAQGLMQVMPQTGSYYGIDNLLDPDQNISAGAQHLKRLQNIFRKYEMEPDELVKFTLAAYNAGEGRILDCRNLAESEGYNNGRWDNIVKVIPLMRDDSILENESVKLGKFQGHETIDYIYSVMSHYEAICQICPTSL